MDQKWWFTWIRLSMICNIVPWWPSWLPDQITFSNSESACCLDRSRTFLASLNLHKTLMPPSFICPTYSWVDVVCRISRWLPWRPSWISELINFIKFEFPCHPSAYHQLSAPSNLPFWSWCGLNILKVVAMVPILDIGTKQLKQF